MIELFYYCENQYTLQQLLGVPFVIAGLQEVNRSSRQSAAQCGKKRINISGHAAVYAANVLDGLATRRSAHSVKQERKIGESPVD